MFRTSRPDFNKSKKYDEQTLNKNIKKLDKYIEKNEKSKTLKVEESVRALLNALANFIEKTNTKDITQDQLRNEYEAISNKIEESKKYANNELSQSFTQKDKTWLMQVNLYAKRRVAEHVTKNDRHFFAVDRNSPFHNPPEVESTQVNQMQNESDIELTLDDLEFVEMFTPGEYGTPTHYKLKNPEKINYFKAIGLLQEHNDIVIKVISPNALAKADEEAHKELKASFVREGVNGRSHLNNYKNTRYQVNPAMNVRFNGDIVVVSRYEKNGSSLGYLRKLYHKQGRDIHFGKHLMHMFENIYLGMEKLHNIGILHLDIAARNVFFTENEEAILADLGLSEQNEDLKNTYINVSNKTMSLRWTDYYCAQTSQASRFTDLYALKTTILEMIAEIAGLDHMSIFTQGESAIDFCKRHSEIGNTRILQELINNLDKQLSPEFPLRSQPTEEQKIKRQEVKEFLNSPVFKKFMLASSNCGSTLDEVMKKHREYFDKASLAINALEPTPMIEYEHNRTDIHTTPLIESSHKAANKTDVTKSVQDSPVEKRPGGFVAEKARFFTSQMTSNAADIHALPAPRR